MATKPHYNRSQYFDFMHSVCRLKPKRGNDTNETFGVNNRANISWF